MHWCKRGSAQMTLVFVAYYNMRCIVCKWMSKYIYETGTAKITRYKSFILHGICKSWIHFEYKWKAYIVFGMNKLWFQDGIWLNQTTVSNIFPLWCHAVWGLKSQTIQVITFQIQFIWVSTHKKQVSCENTLQKLTAAIYLEYN